jgi:cell division protein FtsB
MRNFQQKRGWRNIVESWPVMILLGLILLVFAWGVVGFMGKLSATRENRQMAENKLAELQNERNRLAADIASLKTDRGVEENIREKFGFGKEGEELIVVVDDQTKPAEPVVEKGWFASLWDKLFK